MDIYNFLYSHFNYWVLFVWSVFEGEIGLTLGGVFAKKGKLVFEYVFLISMSGAMIGDIVVFSIGYLSKSKAEKLLKNYEDKVKSIENWFKKYGSFIIVFERFIYGTHIPALLMLGISKFNFFKFLILDIIGVALWALSFTSLGYYFGENALDVLIFIQNHIFAILFLLLFAIIIKKGIKWN